MSGKAIGLRAGFEEVIGMLRGSAGDMPSLGEMKETEGLKSAITSRFTDELYFGGQKIYDQIALVEKKLNAIEKNMTEAVQDQLETEALAAGDLKRILAELDGIQQDFRGDEQITQTAGKPQDTPSVRELPFAK